MNINVNYQIPVYVGMESWIFKAVSPGFLIVLLIHIGSRSYYEEVPVT
ncbi:MAG: hypothetical protein GXP15_13445 [Gammaproteobacteria bacterium]|nr:hypothetical protein [Gammaproteobacteria bacterium]